MTRPEPRDSRYRTLVESTDAVSFAYHPATRTVTYVAPQAARLFGCAPEELTRNVMFGALVHPDDRARVRDTLDDAAARTSTDPIDYRVFRRDRSIVHARMFLSAGEGEVHGILLDITRQKQLEQELLHAQKLESMGRLAAGVAHEINTPIQFVGDSVEFIGNSVADLLEVLAAHQAVLDDPTPERIAAARRVADAVDLPYVIETLPAAVQRATEGVARVATIVRSMKIFAHPPRAEMTEVDLNLAVESTLTVARSEYRYVADAELALGPLPRVTCHVGEINQVLLNIVINAAHAIGEMFEITGRRGTIRVTTAQVGDEVRISIADTGCGIPEDHHANIFEPFFTTKAVGKGTGQGLAMARAVVVDKHGGSLGFDSVPGRGTTFHIQLPISPTPARRVR